MIILVYNEITLVRNKTMFESCHPDTKIKAAFAAFIFESTVNAIDSLYLPRD